MTHNVTSSYTNSIKVDRHAVQTKWQTQAGDTNFIPEAECKLLGLPCTKEYPQEYLSDTRQNISLVPMQYFFLMGTRQKTMDQANIKSCWVYQRS